MAISSVSVDFIANTAKYSQGLDNMSKKTKTWAGGVSKDANKLGEVFKSFASGGIESGGKSLIDFGLKLSGASIALGGFAVAGLAALNFSMEFANRLKDLSERSDISTQALQGLEDAFKSSGVQLEEIVGATEKLSRAGLDAADTNEQLRKSFGKLGIDVDIFNKLTADQKLREFAKSLESLQDPAERAKLSFEILGKTSGNLKVGLSELAKGNDEFNGSFKNSAEALAALDSLSKGYDSFGTIVKRVLVEATGQTVAFIQSVEKIPLLQSLLSAGIFGATIEATLKLNAAADAAAKSSQKQAVELEKVTDAEKRRANALKLSNELFAKSITAFAGSTSPLAAYREEIDKIDKEYQKLIKDQTDVTLLTEAAAVQTDKNTQAYKKFTDALGNRNSFFVATNNAAAFDVEIKKLLGDIREFNKNQINPKERINDADIKILMSEMATKINATAIAFQEIDAPVLKYNRLLTEAAKVTDVFGNKLDPSVIEKYKKSLGKVYTDAINPVEKYKSILSDLNAQEALGIIDGDQKIAYIKTLSKQYTDIINPIEKYKDILKEVLAVPGLSDADAQKYFKTLGDSFRSVIDDSVELKNKLNEVDAAMKGGLGKIITPEEAAAIKTQLQLQYDLTKAGKEAKLINNDKITANVELAATMAEINRQFGAEGENLAKVTERTMAVKEAQAKWMSETIPYFKDAVQFTQNFADGLANAIVSGQNFGDAFRNVFKDILKQIAVLIIRTTILQTIMGAIGFVSGPASAAFGKIAGLPASIPSGGDLATGGPVSVGKRYRVGEAGPETFIPQMNGYILPNDMRSDGGGVTINQTNNFQSGVSRSEIYGLIPKIKAETMLAISDSRARGGSFSRSITA